MRHGRNLLWVVFVALAACHTPNVASKVVAPHAVVPSAEEPSSAPVAVALLRSVAGTRDLGGTVVLDALYASQHAAASVLSVNGAQVVGLDGAHLLGDHGAGVIANNGAGLVSNNSGSLIANNGGSIIANNGGGVIATANDGSSLLGADVSWLAAAAPASYRLLGDAAAPPAFGKELPALGAWVSVVDLKTLKPVSLGVDAAGAPVTSVYTDATGSFKVHVSTSLTGNLCVVARAPGATDPRLSLHVLSAPGSASSALDGSQAAASGYLRYWLATRMQGLLTLSPADVGQSLTNTDSSTSDAVTGALAAQALGQLKDQLLADGVDKLAPAQQLDVTLAGVDALLAGADLAALLTNFEFAKPQADDSVQLYGNKPALALIGSLLAKASAATAAAAAGHADPTAFFATKPYLIAANDNRSAAQAYAIVQPTDMADFIVREYFTATDVRKFNLLDHVFYDLGLPQEDSDGLRAGIVGLTLGIVERFLAGTATAPDGSTVPATTLALQAMHVAALSAASLPIPPAPPAVVLPAPSTPPKADPPGTVDTVAGKAGSGALDGDGAIARFGALAGIAVDPKASPAVVYVSDASNSTIRRLRLDATGKATVDTIAGKAGAAGTADGAGALARFEQPGGLACGPDGTVYVADRLAKTIRALHFDATGAVTVTTVAGGNADGTSDGNGVQAGFMGPVGLALDPQGRLLVADFAGNKIRRIDLTVPAFPVTTLMGDGNPAQVDALQASHARTWGPMGVSVAADGAIYVAEQSSNCVRSIAAPGNADSPTRFVAGTSLKGFALEGFWANARFNNPQGVALDARGRALVVDTGDNRICAVTPAGDVTSVAGSLLGDTDPASRGNADGAADRATFNLPSALAIGPDGTIWVADGGNSLIRRIKPAN